MQEQGSMTLVLNKKSQKKLRKKICSFDVYEYAAFLYKECVVTSNDTADIVPLILFNKIKQIQNVQTLHQLYTLVFHSSTLEIFQNLSQLQKNEKETHAYYLLNLKKILIEEITRYIKKCADEFKKKSDILKKELTKAKEDLKSLQQQQNKYECSKERLLQWLSSYQCLSDFKFQGRFKACQLEELVCFVTNEYRQKFSLADDFISYAKMDQELPKILERQRQDLTCFFIENPPSKPILVIKGVHGTLSEIQKLLNFDSSNRPGELRILLSGSLYLDCAQLKISGINYCMQGKVIDCCFGVTIDTSGKDGLPPPNKAKSGAEKRKEKDYANMINADAGEDGQSGSPGENAGNVIILAQELRHWKNLSIISNGGNGAKGQDGGDGDIGITGKNGVEGQVEDVRTWISSRFVNRYALAAKNEKISKHYKHLPKDGELGSPGGNGGNAGLGGAKGYGGKVYIADKSHVYYDNRKNQAGASTDQENQVDVCANDGEPGKSGEAGKGGEGGKDGSNGVDVGYTCYGYGLWRKYQPKGQELRGRLRVIYEGFFRKYPVLIVDAPEEMVQQQKEYQAGKPGKTVEEQEISHESSQNENFEIIELINFEIDSHLQKSQDIVFLENEIALIEKKIVAMEENEKKTFSILEEIKEITHEIEQTQDISVEEKQNKTINTREYRSKEISCVNENNFAQRKNNFAVKENSIKQNSKDKQSSSDRTKVSFGKLQTKIYKIKKVIGVATKYEDEIMFALQEMELSYAKSSHPAVASNLVKICENLARIPCESLKNLLEDSEIKNLFFYLENIRLPLDQYEKIYTDCENLIKKFSNIAFLLELRQQVVIGYTKTIEAHYNQKKITDALLIGFDQVKNILDPNLNSTIKDQIKFAYYKYSRYRIDDFVQKKHDDIALFAYFDGLISAYGMVKKVFENCSSHMACQTLESCYILLNKSLDVLSKEKQEDSPDTFYIKIVLELFLPRNWDINEKYSINCLENLIFKSINYTIKNNPHLLAKQMWLLSLVNLGPCEIDAIQLLITEDLDKYDSHSHPILLEASASVHSYYRQEQLHKIMDQIMLAIDNYLLKSTLLYEHQQNIKTKLSHLIFEIQTLLENNNLEIKYADRIKYYREILNTLEFCKNNVIDKIDGVLKKIGQEISKFQLNELMLENVILHDAATLFDRKLDTEKLLNFWQQFHHLMKENSLQVLEEKKFFCYALVRLNRYILTQSITFASIAEIYNWLEHAKIKFSTNKFIIEKIKTTQEQLDDKAVNVVETLFMENETKYTLKQNAWCDLKSKFLSICRSILSNSKYIKDKDAAVIQAKINNNLEKYAYTYYLKNTVEDDEPLKFLSNLVEKIQKQQQQERVLTPAKLVEFEEYICLAINQDLLLKLKPLFFYHHNTINLQDLLNLTLETINQSALIILDYAGWENKINLLINLIKTVLFPSHLQENIYKKIKEISDRLNTILPQIGDVNVSKVKLNQLKECVNKKIQEIENPKNEYCPTQKKTDRIIKCISQDKSFFVERLESLQHSPLALRDKQFFHRLKLEVYALAQTLVYSAHSDQSDRYSKLSEQLNYRTLRAVFAGEKIPKTNEFIESFVNIHFQAVIELYFSRLFIFYLLLTKNADANNLKTLFSKLLVIKGMLNKKKISSDSLKFCNDILNDMAANIVFEFIIRKKSIQQHIGLEKEISPSAVHAVKGIANFISQYPVSLEEYEILLDSLDQISEENSGTKNSEIIESALKKIIVNLFFDFNPLAQNKSLSENLLYAFEYILENILNKSKQNEKSEILLIKFSKILEETPLTFLELKYALQMFEQLKNSKQYPVATRQIELNLYHKLYKLFDKSYALSDQDKEVLVRILHSDVANLYVTTLTDLFEKLEKNAISLQAKPILNYFVQITQNDSNSAQKFNRFFTEKEKSLFQQIVSLDPAVEMYEKLNSTLLSSLPPVWQNCLFNFLFQSVYNKFIQNFAVSNEKINKQFLVFLGEDFSVFVEQLFNSYDDYAFTQEEINKLLSPLQKKINAIKNTEQAKSLIEFKLYLSGIITFKKRFNSAKFFLNAVDNDSIWLKFMRLLLAKMNKKMTADWNVSEINYVNNIIFYAQHLNNLSALMNNFQAISFEKWLALILQEKLNQHLFYFIKNSGLTDADQEKIKNKFQKNLNGKISESNALMIILIEKLSNENKLIDRRSKITPHELVKIISKLSKNSIEFSDGFLFALSQKSFFSWQKYTREYKIRIALQSYNFDVHHIDDCVLLLVYIEDKYGPAIMESLLENIGRAWQFSASGMSVVQILRKLNQPSLSLDNFLLEQLKTVSLENWNALIDVHRKKTLCKNKRTATEIVASMRCEQSNESVLHLIKMLDGNKLSELEQLIEIIKQARNTLVPPLDNWKHPYIFLDGFMKKTIIEWKKDDIKNWCRYLKAYCSSKDYFTKNYLQIIAVIAQAIQLLHGHEPYDTQYAALLIYLDAKNNHKSRLGQIATGQGKSLIIQMYAIFLALLNEKVDIVTSSKVLAERDAEEAEPLFQLFDITVSNNCDDECTQNLKLRKERYEKNHVIYGDIASFQRDTLLTDFYQNDVLRNRKVDAVIVDEVDSMMLDKSQNVLYLSHDIPELKYLHNLYVHIWSFVYAPEILVLTNHDRCAEKILTVINQLLVDKRIPLPDTLKPFVDRRLKIWIKNALMARDLSEDDPYIIERSKDGEKILLMDKDTGVELLQTQWSDGLQQFLQLKCSHKLAPESLKAVFISNLTYFHRYHNKIYGLTGTIGAEAERDLLTKTYEVDFFNLPRFQERDYIQKEAIIVANKSTEIIEDDADKDTTKKITEKDDKYWLEAILKDVEVEFQQGRPTLIICENIKAVSIIEKYLKDERFSNIIDKSKIKRYERSYCAFEIGQKNTPIQAGDIIIATNLAGRGTDLKLDDNLKKVSGMHVIMSYLPYNQRIEDQAFGRTARGDFPGTGRFIIKVDDPTLSIEHLKKERDTREELRLERIRIEDLQSIEAEETLFKEFTELYQSFKTKLNKTTFGLGMSSSKSHQKYVELQLKALSNQWALWLDSMSERIKSVSVYGKENLFLEFAKFKAEKETLLAQKNLCKLASSTFELIALGLFLIEKSFYKEAIPVFKQVIAMDPAYAQTAHYYLVIAILNAKGDNYKTRCKIEKHLLKARKLINQRFCELGDAQCILQFVSKFAGLNQNGKKSSQYEKQIKNEQQLLAIHQKAIDHIIGNPVDEKMFAQVYGVRPGQTDPKNIFNKLCQDNTSLIINFHLCENLQTTEVDGKKALHIISDNKERLISFPIYIPQNHINLIIQYINTFLTTQKDRTFTRADLMSLFINKEDFIKLLQKVKCLNEIPYVHYVIKQIDLKIKEIQWPAILQNKKDKILQILVANEGKELTEELLSDLYLSTEELDLLLASIDPFLTTENSRYEIMLPQNAPIPLELKPYELLFNMLPKDVEQGNIYIDLNAIPFMQNPADMCAQVWSIFVNEGIVIEPKVNFPDYRHNKDKMKKRREKIFEQLKMYAYPNLNSALKVCEEEDKISLCLEKEGTQEVDLSGIDSYIQKALMHLVNKKVKDKAGIDKRKIVKEDIADLILTKKELIRLLQKSKRITKTIQTRYKVPFFDKSSDKLSFKDLTLLSHREEIITQLHLHLNEEYSPRLFDQFKLNEEQLAILFQTLKPELEEEIIEFELTFARNKNNEIELDESLRPYQALINELVDENAKDPQCTNCIVHKNAIHLCDDRTEQTEKIWDILVKQEVIHDSVVNFPYFDNPTRRKRSITELVAEGLSTILGKKKKDEYDKLLDSLNDELLKSVGGLKTMPLIEINTKPLRIYLAQSEYPPEVEDYRKIMFDQVITITEKISRFNWGALTVALFGVVQICLGVVLEVFTVGIGSAIAAILISEGIGDIMYATQAGLTGTFSWKAYGIHKAISLVISVFTVGFATMLRPATEVVDIGGRLSLQLFKNSCKRVAKEAIKAVSYATVHVLLESLLKTLPKEIIAQFRAAITSAMHKVFKAVVEPLKNVMRDIFQYTPNPEEVIKQTFERVFGTTRDEDILREIRDAMSHALEALPDLIMGQCSTSLSQVTLDMISKICRAGIIITHDIYEIKKLVYLVKNQYDQVANELRVNIDKDNKTPLEVSEQNETYIDEMVETHSNAMLNYIWDKVTENMAMPHIMGEISRACDKACSKILRMGENRTRHLNTDQDDDQNRNDLDAMSRISEISCQDELQSSRQQQAGDNLKLEALDSLPNDVITPSPNDNQIIQNKDAMTVAQFQTNQAQDQYKFYYDDAGGVYVDDFSVNKQPKMPENLPSTLFSAIDRYQDARTNGQHMLMAGNLSKHFTAKTPLHTSSGSHNQHANYLDTQKDVVFYTKLATTTFTIATLGTRYYLRHRYMQKEKSELSKQLSYLKISDEVVKKNQKTIQENNIELRKFQINSFCFDIDVEESRLLCQQHMLKKSFVNVFAEKSKLLANEYQLRYTAPDFLLKQTVAINDFFCKAEKSLDEFSQLICAHFQASIPESILPTLHSLRVTLQEKQEECSNIHRELMKLRTLKDSIKTAGADEIFEESSLFCNSSQLEEVISMRGRELVAINNSSSLVSRRKQEDRGRRGSNNTESSSQDLVPKSSEELTSTYAKLAVENGTQIVNKVLDFGSDVHALNMNHKGLQEKTRQLAIETSGKMEISKNEVEKSKHAVLIANTQARTQLLQSKSAIYVTRINKMEEQIEKLKNEINDLEQQNSADAKEKLEKRQKSLDKLQEAYDKLLGTDPAEHLEEVEGSCPTKNSV